MDDYDSKHIYSGGDEGAHNFDVERFSCIT